MSAGRFAAGAHERRVARRLEARGLPGLGAALATLRGTEIAGRWRLESLYAAGAEGAVFLAADLRDAGAPRSVAKIPLLPYHRPADLSSGVIRSRREALREEAMNLAKSASPYMAAGEGLFEFVNPLLDRHRGGPFAEPEPVLLMERLPGFDMDVWLARVHRSGVERMMLRPHLDRVAVVLLKALHDLEQRGYYYADLRPGNVRVLGRPERRIRLLDAGSLVATDDTSGRFPHVPHYLPYELFKRRHVLGQTIVPTAAVQAAMAGRTLFEVATGFVPMPGERLEVTRLTDSGVSPAVADVIDGLASGSFLNVVSALRYLTRRAARRAASAVPRSSAVALELPPDPAAARRTWWQRLRGRLGSWVGAGSSRGARGGRGDGGPTRRGLLRL